jgi:hypothetical protein
MTEGQMNVVWWDRGGGLLAMRCAKTCLNFDKVSVPDK